MSETDSPRIIEQHGGLLAVNKPAGMPVHGSRMFEDAPDTLVTWLRNETGQMVHPVHRLDRAVSGLNLFATDKQTLAAASTEFENRRVTKNYLCVVRGWPELSGEIDHPLLPPRDERKESSKPKPAISRFRRLATIELPIAVPPYATARYAMLAIQPLTGRRHQLRRHAKHISHHLVGDTTYGKGEHNRLFRQHFDCHRLLLHSWKLAIQLPDQAGEVEFCSEPDGVFRNVLEKLDWLECLRDSS